MDIVVCTDKRFVMPTGVMMYSLCSNNQDADVTFHVVCSINVSDKDKSDLCGVVSKFSRKAILFYDIDQNFVEKIPAITNRPDITITCYYRLFLTEILPETINRVLYLDGDVIVRDSLLPIWDIDISNYPLAAATDCMVAIEPEEFDRLGYPMSYGYFNSGVCLINLDYWRKHNCLKDFVLLLNKEDEFRYYDQDVLNILFHTSKLNLPIKYNLLSIYYYKNPKLSGTKYATEISDALKQSVVIHYAGSGDKPWYKYSRNINPIGRLFYYYQDRTIWKGVKYDLRPLKLRLINFIADVLRKIGLKTELPKNKIQDTSSLDYFK